MTTLGAVIRVRWYVRREHARLTRLGETTASTVAWAVTPITGLGRTRREVGGTTYFASRAAAFRYVTTEAHRIYGRTTR